MSVTALGVVRAKAAQAITNEPRTSSDRLGGKPLAPATRGFEGMGLEALAALLVAESAHQTAQTMRTLERSAKQAQAAAIERQVQAMRDKAADVKSEALLAGAMTAVGGVVTVASIAAMPSGADAGNAARWEEAGKGAGGVTAIAARRVGEAFKQMSTRADAIKNAGGMVTSLAGPVGRAAYGAEQTVHDAESTRAAADAKFAEAAREEYASLAREAKATVEKAHQALQAFAQERQMARRAILRAG